MKKRDFSFAVFFLLLSWLQPVLAETHVVIVRDPFQSPSFYPKDISVNEGDIVRWEWDENNVDEHDVRAGNLPNLPSASYQEAFVSEIGVTGMTFEVAFDRDFLNQYSTPGDLYNYYCGPHWAMGMAGSVTVARLAKPFKATLNDWQAVPKTSSLAAADCSLTLSADETSVAISCTHTISSPQSLELRGAALGANGSLICSWDISGTSSGLSCALNSEQAQAIWDGQAYLLATSDAHPTGELRGQIVHASGAASIAGVVSSSEGAPIPQVAVSAGVLQAQSDSQGIYIISSVPNGVYQLVAELDGLTIAPDLGVSPVLVNNTNSTFKNFTALLDPQSSAAQIDSDGDCVADAQELLDGSNANDAGSYRTRLSSPVYVLWNGFIDLVNILELVNRSDGAVVMSVSMFNIAGQPVHQQQIALAPRSQQDLIINDIAGFQKDSYGLIRISFDEQYSGKIDGRMFYYRTASDGGGYEFAFGTGFERPLCVDSFVAFNTFQPSLSSAETENLVAQWLALVNLDSETSQSFNVRRYNQSGTLIQDDVVHLAPFGRTDLEAGHVNPGPSNVGLIEIDPLEDGKPYLAQLFRYGGNSGAGQAPSEYSFAFPLLARHGNGEKTVLPISKMSDAQNWLEVVNTLSQSTNVSIEFRGSAGGTLQQTLVTLPPHGQQHFNASALLGANESGSVLIVPESPESIVAQSMYYFRDLQSGSVSAMYGSQAREPLGGLLIGTYNRFISMDSWMRVGNLLNAQNSLTMTVYTSSGSETFPFTLAPNATLDIGVHEDGYGTSENTYGLVTVQGQSYGSLTAELIRMRPDLTAGGESLDFAAPTEVR